MTDSSRNDTMGGIFLLGVTTGIVLSYSGFLGFFAGIGTGILVCSKYGYKQSHVPDNVTQYYQSAYKFVREYLTSQR